MNMTSPPWPLLRRAILIASVLAPSVVFGQQGGLVLPGGGGYAIPQSAVPSGPVSPYAPPSGPPNIQDGYGKAFGFQDGGRRCLQASTLSGVVASNDREAILRFGRDSFYRVRLSKACPALAAPGAHVTSVARGRDICSSGDVELKVASDDGSITSCPASSLNRMGGAEVSDTSRSAYPRYSGFSR
jgi:hypothetical protein